jgi:endonuclease YncB( thermonuclease family)
MPRVSDILIVDGHAFSWKRLCELRGAQLEAARKAEAAQLALFEARQDCRPVAERTATSRYLEPGLLELLHR